MYKNISLVIPSINPKKINEIIKKVNKWSIKPSEILFCFPLSLKKKLKKKFKLRK